MTGHQPRLVETGRGYTVRYRGKNLYSSRDPWGAAVRRVQKLEIRPNTLVFVPSVGLGYGLSELVEKLPDSCHILCVEADESLFRLAVEQSRSLLSGPGLTVLRTTRPDQVAAVVQQLGPWRYRRVVSLHLCAGYQFHRRTYELLLSAVEEEIHLFWQNRLTLMAMTRLWLKNLFTNIRFLPRAGSIADLATDRPILVCGAGPSLEDSLEWIERIRERVILVAVDTALPVLAASGLLPEWVFTLDAQLYTLQDFLPHRDSRIVLLCDLTSNPQSLRLFRDIYFFSTRFHPLPLFDRLESSSLLPPSLPPRGSVGVSAVEAALAITSGVVLFTGLDFGYPKNQTHARGAPSHLNMLQDCYRLRPCGMNAFQTLLARPRLRLKDKNGRVLLSDLVLHSYARQLAAVNESSPRSFDLSAHGLPVGAPRIETVEELVDLCGRGPCLSGVAPAAPTKPGASAVRRFCMREAELLSEVVRRIGGSDQALSEALAPVEYLRLSLPGADPGRPLSPADRSRIAEHARLLSLYLERSRTALDPTV